MWFSKIGQKLRNLFTRYQYRIPKGNRIEAYPTLQGRFKVIKPFDQDLAEVNRILGNFNKNKQQELHNMKLEYSSLENLNQVETGYTHPYQTGLNIECNDPIHSCRKMKIQHY